MPSSYPLCPLCGGDAGCESCSPDEWMVQCQWCFVQGPVCATREDAEDGWERLCSLASERDRMRDACSRLNDSVCQTLGKALGYPPLYPDVSDVDDGSVCVGEHVAETIAAEAAGRLASMVRLPPGADSVEGDLGDGGQAVWDVERTDEGGWCWAIYHYHGPTTSTESSTLQEACDRVRAELERLEGDDDE